MSNPLPASFHNVIGPQVQQLRILKGWSQAQLAAELRNAGWEVSPSDVAKIEARTKPVNDFEFLFLIEVLEVEMKDLFPR